MATKKTTKAPAKAEAKTVPVEKVQEIAEQAAQESATKALEAQQQALPKELSPEEFSKTKIQEQPSKLEEKQAKFNVTIENDKLKNQIAIDNTYKIFRIKVGSDMWEDWYIQLQKQGWDLF